MPQIHQLTADDIARSSTLEPEDVGKWVWVANGCLQGFADSHEEAQDMLSRLLPPREIAVLDQE